MNRVNIRPVAKKLTLRKRLAQNTRRRLDAYRNVVSHDENRTAIRLLLEAEAEVQQLLALETSGTYGNLNATALSVMASYKKEWTSV